jgi:hypothetical protein
LGLAQGKTLFCRACPASISNGAGGLSDKRVGTQAEQSEYSAEDETKNHIEKQE